MTALSWHRPAQSGGAEAHAAFITETVSHDTAVVDNDGTSYNVDLAMTGAGPYYLRQITVTQIGGTYAGGAPSFSMSGHFDTARVEGWSFFPSLIGALPLVSKLKDAEVHDQDDGDELHFTWSDSTGSDTVQYRIAFELSRPREASD